MKMSKKNMIKMGTFIVAGISLFIFSIYYIGIQENLFRTTFTLKCIFEDVSGLEIGDDVNFSGIEVGSVKNITIINDTTIELDLLIDEDVKKFIRKTSEAEITSEGLIGGKALTISPGYSTSPVVEDGDYLKTVEAVKIDDIIKKINEASNETIKITRNIASITQRINNGEGIFGKIFSDTAFSNNLDRIGRNTAILTDNFAGIASKINRQEGVIGKLLSDTAYNRQFDNTFNKVSHASNNLNKITKDLGIVSEDLIFVSKKIKSDKGIFGKLFTDTAFLQNLYNASKNTDRIAKELAEVAKSLNSEGGIAYKILSDTSFADSFSRTIYNLNDAILNINETAKNLQNKWYIRSSKYEKEKNKAKRKEE